MQHSQEGDAEGAELKPGSSAAQAEAAVLQLRSFPCMDLFSQVLTRNPTLLPASSLARILRVCKAAEWGSFKFHIIKPFVEQTT